MTIGDLVRVHWGDSNWEGEEGTDWGYAPAIVMGEIRWWNETVVGRSPCGDANILFRGEVVSFNIGRLEVINESR